MQSRTVLLIPLLFIVFETALSIPNCASVPPALWCSNKDLSQQCGFDKYCQRYTTATRNQKINITVLIEALCPDCQQLIVNELYPNVYTKFKDYVNIEFIPYGNARILSNGTIQCQHGEEECKINKFESCLIDAVQTQDQYVPLIYCLENQLMKQTPFEDAAEKCFKQLSVSDQTQRMIQGCLVTSLSEKLQKKAADLTANVWPEKHRFVPWILFNGVSIESVQSWADIIPTLICSWYNGDKKIPGCDLMVYEKLLTNDETSFA